MGPLGRLLRAHDWRPLTVTSDWTVSEQTGRATGPARGRVALSYVWRGSWVRTAPVARMDHDILYYEISFSRISAADADRFQDDEGLSRSTW